MKKIIRTLLLSVCFGLMISQVAFAANETTTTTDNKTSAVASTPTALTAPSAAATTAAINTVEFSPEQIKQLDKIIHDYIVNNPNVLVEASQTLQNQQEKKMEAAAVTSIEQNKKALFDDAKTPTIGNKDAPVKLVEFFDYQCGHCRAMQSTLEKLIVENKNVQMIFKELPIFGGMSDYAAKVALAAAMQSPEKYYAFHNAMLTTQTALTKESIMAIAKKTGLDIAKLKKEMDSPEIDTQLKLNFQLAQNLKVMGTPTFVIANREQTKFGFIPGATTLEDLKVKIQSVQ